MMDTNLEKLAERVERAGPDRELDLAIAKVRRVNPVPAGATYDYALDDGKHAWSAGMGMGVPAYTASLDAAMTLVPEGCGVKLDRYWIGRQEGPVWSAHLAFGGIPESPRRVHEAFDAETPPLALGAAVLRAAAKGDARAQDGETRG